MIKSPRVRVLLISVLAIASVALLVWFLQKRSGHYASDALQTQNRNLSASQAVNTISPTPQIAYTPISTPTPSVEPTPSASPVFATSPVPSPSVEPSSQPPRYDATLNLIVPVAGVQRDQLRDTFADARSEGRLHDAIDIAAPAGTPVLAAADGEIIKLFQSDKGGTTIYQLSTDKKLVFYYAHLQRYADSLAVGKYVRQGEVIGYVGDTGNAGPGNYHLHFSISLIADPKHYWEGTNVNPFPLLRK